VDVARAILRASPDFIDRVPGILNRGAGEAQIQFIHRLPDGKGMVSILSAERLFRDETVARILADTHQEEHDMEVSSSSRTLERVLAFQLGDEAFGLPIDTVVEVLSLPDKLTRVPHAPDFLQGVMNYRGAMLPIVDQRSRFGLAAARDKAHRRVIVVKVDGIKVGFIVDSVSQILSLRADQVQDAPSLTAGGERLFDRIATLEANGRIVLLIEPRQLLKRAEMDVLASLEKRVGDAAGL
jgi:purine-binding chemotaxis protein CheW